jgi:PAS domain S-box-containing protein
MPWIVIATAAAACSVFILMLVNLYLYHCYRERFLRIWAVAWGIYAFRYICLIAWTLQPGDLFLQAANYLFIIASASVLFGGMEPFLGRPPKIRLYLCAGLVSLWTVIAVYSGMPFLYIVTPVFATVSATYIFIGSRLIKVATNTQLAQRLVGWLFVIWGVHQADFPLLRPIPWFAPWGFLLGSILATCIAIGMILIYYEKTLQALQEKESLHRNLIEASHDWIWEVDAGGVYTYSSPLVQDLLGYTPQEIIGKTPFDLMPAEEASRIREIFTDIFSQRLPFRRLENINQHKNGSRVVLETNGAPFFDAKQNYLGYRGMAQDITEIKLNEEKRLKLEAQLQQAQKIEAIGQLAGGVAHDFNNMLSVILGHAEMAMDEIDNEHPLFADLREIKNAAQRSAGVTRQLLSFARKQTITPQILDLNETVESTLKMLRRLIGEDVDLIWKPGNTLWPIKIDPSQVDQILANLCVNARDAISGGGTIVVETENRGLDKEFCRNWPYIVPGDYVMLAVSDTGCGMNEETLAHLFEPFFTTKETGRGTGLGLATVYGIVKQNQSYINVETKPGQGSVFTIFMPRYASSHEQAGTKDRHHIEEDRRHETILLVEDEKTIMEMTMSMLQRMGYSVIAASTPSEAINAVQAFGNDIHLLITDMIMPEMNGKELAERLAGVQPAMKFLFMSGYTADIISKQSILDEQVNFLQKPFTKNDLAVRVRAALGH